MSVGSGGLLGRIAIHYKLVSPDQLAGAIREQGRLGNRKRLGELLLELGFVSREQLDWLLQAQDQLLAKQREQKQQEQQELQEEHAIATDGGRSIIQPQASDAPRTRAKPSVPPPVAEPMPPPVAPAPPVPAAPASSAAAAPGGDRTLDRILTQAVKLRASDVHLHAGSPIQMRVGGRLLPAKTPPLDAAETERLLFSILEPGQRTRLTEKLDLDFAYSIAGTGRFRGSAYRQQRGFDAVFRPIPPEPPTLDGLGLPSSLAKLITFHQGLVLVTGPAGCGKSSTMAALVNLINEERRDHIITVEDPIEYLHPAKRCVVNQRQVLRHTESFATALRAALREDPDVIAIGELRDLETVSLAITAAETGHLVLATLHTSNAIRTINRVLDVFPPKQQPQIRAMVSESLRAIVSQRLVTTTDGSRRVPALEILIVNPAVSNLIRDEKTFQIKSILQTGRAQGMCTIDDSLAELVRAGTVTREEARRHSEDARALGSKPPVAVGA
jgi:twitching motility protein PilT